MVYIWFIRLKLVHELSQMRKRKRSPKVNIYVLIIAGSMIIWNKILKKIWNTMKKFMYCKYVHHSCQTWRQCDQSHRRKTAAASLIGRIPGLERLSVRNQPIMISSALVMLKSLKIIWGIVKCPLPNAHGTYHWYLS